MSKETREAMDVNGTNHKGCKWYDARACHYTNSEGEFGVACIGTRMCNIFWDWFLKENQLLRA